MIYEALILGQQDLELLNHKISTLLGEGMRPVAVALGTVREMNEAFGRPKVAGEGIPPTPPSPSGLSLCYQGSGFDIRAHINSEVTLGELLRATLDSFRHKEPPKAASSGNPVA